MSNYQRSPNYPGVSLPKTIGRLRKFSNLIDREISDENEVARKIGYGGVSGASVPIISSLKKFGLVEVQADGFRFSDAALKLIMVDDFAPGIPALLEKLASKPNLYRQIREQFEGKVPSSQELTLFLADKGFVPKHIHRVIDAYYETIELVSALQERDWPTSEAQVGSGSEEGTEDNATNAIGDLSFTIAEGIQIVVKLTGTLPSDSVDTLTDFLKQTERFRLSK